MASFNSSTDRIKAEYDPNTKLYTINCGDFILQTTSCQSAQAFIREVYSGRIADRRTAEIIPGEQT